MNIFVPQTNRYVCPVIIRMLRGITSYKIKIVTCDPTPKGITAGSVWADKHYQSPPLIDACTDLNFIEEVCERESIDLVFPYIENELKMLSRNKEGIPAKMVIPDIETLELFLDKKCASMAVADIPLPVPAIVTDMCKAPPQLIARKRQSAGSKGITFIDLDKDSYIPNVFNEGHFVQERVSGNEYTVDVLSDTNGGARLVVPRRRIRIQDGVSTICRIEKNEALIEACLKLYGCYRIPGISCAQFIVSDEGTPYFIELNPRIAGTSIASMKASFNFLKMMLDEVILGIEPESFDRCMSYVVWGTVISRYYDEEMFPGKS